jgi:hypothetical protein
MAYGMTIFWNRCTFRFFDHWWNLTKESSSAFSTMKRCIRTNFTPDLRRNSRMIFTSSTTFNVGASMLGRGENITNGQIGLSLDSSTRKSSPAWIASHFIQHIQLLRSLEFYIRWYLVTYEIRLAWKLSSSMDLTGWVHFSKRSQEFFDDNSFRRIPQLFYSQYIAYLDR